MGRRHDLRGLPPHRRSPDRRARRRPADRRRRADAAVHRLPQPDVAITASDVRRHLDKVACQSCHIPTFARAVSTDMLRDFRSAEVNERGLYEPKIIRGSRT